VKTKNVCRFFLGVFLILSGELYSQGKIIRSYEFKYGSNPNMETGAGSSYYLSSLIFDQANAFLKKKKPDNILLRALNAGIIQLFAGKELYCFIPHEYFGHVKRLEEFNLPHNGFQMRFPAVGGYTKFKLLHEISPEKRLLVSAAGPEIWSLISHQASGDLYSGSDVPAYLNNIILFNKLGNYIYYKTDFPSFFNNPQAYVNKIKSNPNYPKNPGPGDFGLYAFTLTESYGYYDNLIHKDSVAMDFSADANLLNNPFIRDQNRRINTSILLSLADMALIQFFTSNYQYIIKGKVFYKPFMFQVKGVKFMPSIRSNLGEIGAENYFDIFMVLPNKNRINIYYRNGGNMIHKINGFGASLKSFTKNKVNINAEIDYWFNGKTIKNNFNAATEVQYKLNDQMQILGTIGYKTKGNLMGKPFNTGFYGCWGIAISLAYEK
jgi:hypothetical protein